jgi:hypothetical protein
MQEEIENKPGLPLPKWAMIVLAFPTFYMPLAYLIMAVWAIGSILSGYSFDVPDWMMSILEPALYVTFVMWPFYLFWVMMCKRLKRNERVLWLLIVIVANMFGMPMFYIFITRRYQGKEGQTNIKDENVAQSLLTKCNLSRAELSPEQWRIWVSYCRKVRFCRLGLIPMFLMAALLFYTAIWYIPNMASDSCVPETVIIDSVKNTKKEILPDVQAVKTHIYLIMIQGAMGGMAFFLAIFMIVQSIGFAYLDWHRKAFIDFLKAKNTGSPHNSLRF